MAISLPKGNNWIAPTQRSGSNVDDFGGGVQSKGTSFKTHLVVSSRWSSLDTN